MHLPGFSTASWSLVCYRDLASFRTLNLQALIMAATLLVLVLVLPAAAAVIWALILRPQFAPEWLWPNPARMLTYIYQIAVYGLLIGFFFFLVFTRSTQLSLISLVPHPFTPFR